MGKIILSCGHEEPTNPTGWSIYYGDVDEFGDESLVSASYCVSCVAEHMRNYPENTFFNFEEAWEAVFGQKESV